MTDKPTKIIIDTKQSVIVQAPPNSKFYIESLWAYLSEDERGHEGVCATVIGGTFLPMIAADRARLDQLRPHAEVLARAAAKAGTKVKLVRFEKRVEVEEVKP